MNRFKHLRWQHVFYFASALCLFSRYELVHQQMREMNRPAAVLAMFYFCCLGFLILSFLPRALPLLAFVLWWGALALLNSFGKVAHSLDGWMWVSLGMTIGSFLKRDSRSTFDFAVVGATHFYAISALWKWKSLVSQEALWAAAARNLPEHIAYGLAEHYRPEGVRFLEYFLSHPNISAVTWIGVMTFQLLAPIGALFWERMRMGIFVGLIGFHVGARWVVGPDFTPQIYLLILMSCISLNFTRNTWRYGAKLDLTAIG